ncbi:MAG: alpha/beta fold hydrolase, partial [Hungatella sp.]
MISVKEEFCILSSDGASKLHCVRWMPEGETYATLQITHGMMEHILRYDAFAAYLAERGVAVIGHDHLGHGTTSESENLGFFAEHQGEVLMIKDIHRVTKRIARQYPHIPHLIMGHSMGSFFLRRYLTLYGDQVDGAILMGTGNQPLLVLAAGKLLAGFIGFIRGSRYRSRLMQELVLGTYNRAFRPNRTTNDWLSGDPEMVDRFLEDPYCGVPFSCAAYYDFFNLLLDLKLQRQFDRIPKALPLLLTSGEEDPVGGFGKGVIKVYEQFQK